MAKTFQIKRGAKSTMPTLAQGELGFVTDANAEELYIGNGSQNIQIARQDAVDNLAEKVVQADLGVNDETDPAYVKNRTHYIDSEYQEVFAYTELTCSLYGDTTEFYYKQLGDADIGNDDNTYIVELDGVKYQMTGTELYSTNVVVNKVAPEDGEPPFGFYSGYLGAGTYVECILIYSTSASHTLAIEKVVETVISLDDKYIPTTVPVIQSAAVGQTILVKAVDEDGKPTEWEASDINALPIEGGTITGPDIYLNNGTGRLMSNGDATQIEVWETAGDDSKRRILTLYDNDAKENVSEALTITDRKDGVNTEYKIYGEHNKPTPGMLGAVSKTGDAMTGNLHIQDTTNNAESFFQHYDHRTILAARNVINDGANERMLQISDSTTAAPLTGALQLVDTVDGTKSYYNIIHEGNKELIKPSDIGATAEGHTHKATEVGALPIEGGTITGTSIYLNGGTGRVASNGDAAQIEAWTTVSDDSERRILAVYDKGAKDSVASALVLTDRVGSANTEYKIYGEHNKPSPADIGAAATSHGNHVPTTETANNARFLRNDNTWQTVTPANIGAATIADIDDLQAQLDAMASLAITVHTGTEEPTSNMGEDGDLYVYTGG